jgi:hypothetical protein
MCERTQIINNSSYWLPEPGVKLYHAYGPPELPFNPGVWPPQTGYTYKETYYFTIARIQATILGWASGGSAIWVRYPEAEAYTDRAPTASGVELFDDPAKLLADAGLNSAGFTRHVPTDDGTGGYTVQYGYFTKGDYIGPHLWNEVKACLKLLTARKIDLLYTTGTKETYSGKSSYDKSGKSWAVLEAEALAAYASSSYLDIYGALCRKDAYIQSWTPPYAGNYYHQVFIERRRTKPKFILSSAYLNANVDIYAYAIKSYYTDFDGNGDFTETNKFKFFETVSVPASAPSVPPYIDCTQWIGSIDPTIPPNYGPSPVDGDRKFTGWAVGGTTSAVARYGNTLTYGST